MFADVFTSLEKRIGGNADESGLMKIKPAIDIYETENSIVVLADMPRIDKKELKVQVKDGRLLMSGKRMNKKIEGEYLLRETCDVFYERIFELEDDLDFEKIEATYQAGVLKVAIGKKEKVKPREIDIN